MSTFLFLCRNWVTYSLANHKNTKNGWAKRRNLFHFFNSWRIPPWHNLYLQKALENCKMSRRNCIRGLDYTWARIRRQSLLRIYDKIHHQLKKLLSSALFSIHPKMSYSFIWQWFCNLVLLYGFVIYIQCDQSLHKDFASRFVLVCNKL